MKFPMRLFLTALLLAGITATPALCATALRAQDLPSAPSSTSKQPAPPPQAAPQPAVQSAPAPQATAVSQPPKPVAAPAPTTVAAKDDEPADTGTIIKKRVDEVNVIFTVTDKGGKFIKGLKQEDFSVLDDKK